jgi:hypothetical protein
MGRSKNKLKPMIFHQPAQTETCDIDLLLHNCTVEPDEWVKHYLLRGGDPSGIGRRCQVYLQFMKSDSCFAATLTLT